MQEDTSDCWQPMPTVQA